MYLSVHSRLTESEEFLLGDIMRDNLIVRIIDAIASGFQKRDKSLVTDEQIEEYFGGIEADYKRDRMLFDLSFGLFSALDTKTSALLTHVSLLVAAVAVIYTRAKPGSSYSYLLGVEFLLYLASTILCLRCIRYSMPKMGDVSSHRAQVFQEILIRRDAYMLSSNIAIISTASFVITLIGHAFLTTLYP